MKRILLIIAVLVTGYMNAQVIGADMIVKEPKTTAEMNAITVAQGLAIGAEVRNSDTGTIWWYNGTIWVDTGSAGSADWPSITNKPANLDEDSTDDVTLSGLQTITGVKTFNSSGTVFNNSIQLDQNGDDTMFEVIEGADYMIFRKFESGVHDPGTMLDRSYRLEFSGDPTVPQSLADKEYVDAAVAGSAGDVTATAGNFSADERLLRTDGANSKNVQESGITIDDTDNIGNVANFSFSGYLNGANEVRLTPDNAIGSTVGKNSYSFKTGDIAYFKRVDQAIGLGLDFSGLTTDQNLTFTPTDVLWNGSSLLSGGSADGLGSDRDVGLFTVSNSGNTAALNDNTVNTNKIVNGTILGSDIAANTVSGGNIQDASIGSGDLASNSVGTDKLDALAVTEAKIAADAVTAPKIAASAVGTSEIQDGSIAAIDLATNSVDTNKISDGSITESKLDVNSGTSAADKLIALDGTGGFKLVDDQTGAGTDDQTLSLAGTGNKDLTIETGNTVDLTTVDGVDPDNIVGTITGRTGNAITAMMEQTAAQLTTDGDPSAGQFVLCSNCAPLTDAGGATIDFSNGNQREDDRANDAATITFSNLTVNGELQVGAFVKIRYNRASEPAYSGATMKLLPNTFAFPANTECVGVYEVNDDGEIDYYFYEVTP